MPCPKGRCSKTIKAIRVIKAERDICSICGQDVEKTLDGDRFCNKCGWVDEYEGNERFKNRTRWSK
jgi:anaerobic ribonucleoside-triphosphate reductase